MQKIRSFWNVRGVMGEWMDRVTDNEVLERIMYIKKKKRQLRKSQKTEWMIKLYMYIWCLYNK